MASYSLAKRRTGRKKTDEEIMSQTGGAVAPGGSSNAPVPIGPGRPQPTTRHPAGGGKGKPKPKPKPKPSPLAKPKPTPTGARAPFDLMKSPYQTQGDLTAAAGNMVDARLNPQLSEVERRRALEESKHAQRKTDISSWGEWLANKLSASQAAGSTSLQGVQNNMRGIDANTVGNLAGAFGASEASQGALQSRLGGPGPASQEAQQLLTAAMQAQQGSQQQLGTNIGAMMTAATETAQQAPVAIQSALMDEIGINRSALGDLDTERRDLTNQRGDLLTEAEGALTDRELQRATFAGSRKDANREYRLAKKQFGEAVANRMFQEDLAREELGLSKKQLRLQRRLGIEGLDLQNRQQNLAEDTFEHSKQIDWANVGISQQQANNDLKALEAEVKNAKGEKAKERAQLRAQGYINGLEVLNGYMGPTDNEYVGNNPTDEQLEKGMTPYETGSNRNATRTWETALQKMIQAGTPRAVALQILSRSEIPRWAQRGQRELDRLKLRRQTNRGNYNGSSWPPG